jgi:hypothetical protein
MFDVCLLKAAAYQDIQRASRNIRANICIRENKALWRRLPRPATVRRSWIPTRAPTVRSAPNPLASSSASRTVSVAFLAECTSPARAAISLKNSKRFQLQRSDKRAPWSPFSCQTAKNYCKTGCTKVVQIIYMQALDDCWWRRADSTLESRNPVL